MARVAAIQPSEKSSSESALSTVTLNVTPQQAEDWLNAMPSQRRVRENKVAQLVRQILEGRWSVLPHGLVFDEAGHLIDGQHRLTAIVRSGCAVTIRATFNASSEDYLKIDSVSAPKSSEDVLRHAGVPTRLAQIMGAPLRMLFRIDRGASPFHNDLNPSHEEMIETFLLHSRLVDAAEKSFKVRICPVRSLLSFYVFQAMKEDEKITSLFCEQLASGESLFAGDPALLLRNTWIKDRLSRTKHETPDQARMMVHAFNAALKGWKLRAWRAVDFSRGSRIPSIGE